MELSIIETSFFLVVLILYTAAAVVGVRQLWRGQDKYGWLLIALTAVGASLESVILVLRALAIQAFPLTGLFESMIVLTVVFGLTFLFLSVGIRQVWFGSVMVWIIFVMAILSASVAQPATQLQLAARTPWIVAHGIAMVLAGAMIAFATGSAVLFLLGRWKLKQKQIVKLIGKVPNIEKLEGMNLFALKACLVLMTFGLVTGIGMAMVRSAVLEISAFEWLTDAKIVLIATAWLLLAVILGFRRVVALKGRMTALLTVAAFLLILFAFVGTTIFCGSKHDFRAGEVSRVEIRE